MNVPEAVIKVLLNNPGGLSAKMITDEILSKKYYSFISKNPVEIVARAINRHCNGIDRSYSCQDKYFTSTKDKSGTPIYKLIQNESLISTGLVRDFKYPSHQIIAINSTQNTRGNMKTRIMDAENQSVRNLLDKYCFYVPDYQRSYSWKISHIDEFLEDLFNVIHSDQTDARHFLGAITMAKRDARQNAIDLIDGQQRMTTIFIFLYVILGEYRSERFSSKAKGRADELLRKLAYLNDDGDSTGSRLVLGEFNKEFFDEFIIKGHEKKMMNVRG